MAEKYPHSKFYGADASAVFPESIKPQNCIFQTANIVEKIPFPDSHFDFIYQRLLIFGLTGDDWKNVCIAHCDLIVRVKVVLLIAQL